MLGPTAALLVSAGFLVVWAVTRCLRFPSRSGTRLARDTRPPVTPYARHKGPRKCVKFILTVRRNFLRRVTRCPHETRPSSRATGPVT